jgi:prevent-host-death family protein
MRAVGLKTLKNKLNQYVRMAANGETILVTERGRVIAQLCPPRAGRSSSLADATLAEVVRQGWLSPPALASSDVPPRLPVAPFATLMRELDADRNER